MAIAQQKPYAAGTGATDQTSAALTLNSAATAGNVLLALVAVDKAAGTFTLPSGWSRFSGIADYSGDISLMVITKTAAGGETGVTITWSTASRFVGGWMAEFSGVTLTSALSLDADSGSSNVTSLALSSLTAAGSGDAIAIVAVDSCSSWGGLTSQPSWDNSFTIAAGQDDLSTWADVGAPGWSVATKTVTAGSVSTTASWSSGGSGDQAAGALIILPASGGSPPGQVTGLSATAASSSQINLSWDATSGATSYKVERSPTGSGSWTELVTGHTSTTYSSTGLSASTTYYYRVRATNANGDGTYSSTANATTSSGGSAPAAPTSPGASALSSSSIRVSWTASAGATSYTVERSPNGSSGWSAVVTGHAGSPYDDTGLSPSTTYYYRVYAVNGSGSSSASSTVNATTSAAGTGTTYTANASWRWIQVEWPTSHRIKKITTSGTAAGGATSVYFAATMDGATWSYFSGPLTSGVMTAVANQAAAESAAFSLASITGNSISLPTMIEGRIFRIYFRNTTHSTTWREYYPRRLVQADDIEAEAIRAIHISSDSITADMIQVDALDGFTITGATIRTAASGARVEMSGTAVYAVDSGGVVRVEINPDGLLTRDSAGNIQVQATTATNGALKAGAGAVTLDKDGARIEASTSDFGTYTAARSLSWHNGSTTVGYVAGNALTVGSAVLNGLILSARASSTGYGVVSIGAQEGPGGASAEASIGVVGGSTGDPQRINLTARFGQVNVTSDMRVRRTSDTATGTLTVEGDLNLVAAPLFGGVMGGINVGTTGAGAGQIATSGNVAIRGAPNSATGLRVLSPGDTSASFPLILQNAAGSLTLLYIQSLSSSTCEAWVADTAWTYASDDRMKERLRPLEGGALARLARLAPKRFRYKGDGREHVGFVAQEVRDIYPELVSENAEGVLGLRTTDLIPELVAALGELAARVNELERRPR